MNTIRLTESDLHQMVKESVNKVLKEADRHRPDYFKDKPLTNKYNRLDKYMSES